MTTDIKNRPSKTAFKLGMRDAPTAWTDATGDPAQSIAALQEALKAVGLLGPGAAFRRGTYDAVTQTAVRRFQWYGANVEASLDRTGAYQSRRIVKMTVNGVADAEVFDLLRQFTSFGWSVTGSLVKIDFDALTRVHANIGFTALVKDMPTVGLFDRSFADVIIGMDRLAIKHGVHVFVNQLFRLEGAVVSGAVVTPAGYSAHKLGRAIDLQLGTEAQRRVGNPKMSTEMMKASSTSPFGKFRDGVKEELKCRYGGNFKDKDPPHFDRQITPAPSDTWNGYFYFNQLQYQQSLVNPEAIPSFVVTA